MQDGETSVNYGVHRVRTVRRETVVPTPDERLRHRILAIVGAPDLWPRGLRAGRSWWQLRQALGGSASTHAVRSMVDQLIAEGLVLELWQETRNLHQPRHLIALADSTRWDPRGIIKAVGREDVLDRHGLGDDPRLSDGA